MSVLSSLWLSTGFGADRVVLWEWSEPDAPSCTEVGQALIGHQSPLSTACVTDEHGRRYNAVALTNESVQLGALARADAATCREISNVLHGSSPNGASCQQLIDRLTFLRSAVLRPEPGFSCRVLAPGSVAGRDDASGFVLSVSRLNEPPSTRGRDAALTMLFALLPAPVIAEVVRHLAQERSVLLHAPSLLAPLLPDIASAAASLLFPLRWQMGVLTRLPPGLDLETALGAPVPMLIALPSELVEGLDPAAAAETLVVNIAAGTAVYAGHVLAGPSQAAGQAAAAASSGASALLSPSTAGGMLSPGAGLGSRAGAALLSPQRQLASPKGLAPSSASAGAGASAGAPASRVAARSFFRFGRKDGKDGKDGKDTGAALPMSPQATSKHGALAAGSASKATPGGSRRKSAGKSKAVAATIPADFAAQALPSHAAAAWPHDIGRRLLSSLGQYARDAYNPSAVVASYAREGERAAAAAQWLRAVVEAEVEAAGGSVHALAAQLSAAAARSEARASSCIYRVVAAASGPAIADAPVASSADSTVSRSSSTSSTLIHGPSSGGSGRDVTASNKGPAAGSSAGSFAGSPPASLNVQGVRMAFLDVFAALLQDYDDDAYWRDVMMTQSQAAVSAGTRGGSAATFSSALTNPVVAPADSSMASNRSSLAGESAGVAAATAAIRAGGLAAALASAASNPTTAGRAGGSQDAIGGSSSGSYAGNSPGTSRPHLAARRFLGLEFDMPKFARAMPHMNVSAAHISSASRRDASHFRGIWPLVALR